MHALVPYGSQQSLSGENCLSKKPLSCPNDAEFFKMRKTAYVYILGLLEGKI